MAVLTKEEYFAKLHERLGSDTSDEGISFIEDMTDTYNDMEKKSNGDGVDWEKKYKELDESWKKRYRHRFFSGDGGVPNERDRENNSSPYNPEDVTVSDLFIK